MDHRVGGEGRCPPISADSPAEVEILPVHDARVESIDVQDGLFAIKHVTCRKRAIEGADLDEVREELPGLSRIGLCPALNYTNAGIGQMCQPRLQPSASRHAVAIGKCDPASSGVDDADVARHGP